MADIKQIPLNASIDTNQAVRVVAPWGEARCDVQTGIFKDGGVTNMRLVSEDIDDAEETIYTRSGRKVQLARAGTGNSIEDVVLVDGEEVGRVPAWALERREIVPVTADDCMLSDDAVPQILALTISGGAITLRTYDAATFDPLEVYTGSCSADYGRGFFVRYVAHTAETGLSFIGVSAAAVKIIKVSIAGTAITVDAEYTVRSLTSYGPPPGQIYAWYSTGWAVCLQGAGKAYPLATAWVYLFKSTGAADSAEPWLNAHYAVAGWVPVLTIYATGQTISGSIQKPMYAITAPSTAGGDWTVVTTSFSGTPTAARLSAVSCPGAIAAQFETAASKLTGYVSPLAGAKEYIQGPKGLSQICGPVGFGFGLSGNKDLVIKTHTIGGDGAYLSAAPKAWDYQGVPITEIGEIASDFCPYFVYSETTTSLSFIYQRGDQRFAILTLNYAPTFRRLQEIAKDVVAINSISAGSIVDAENRILRMGPSAYNGFAYYATGTALTGSNTRLWASRFSNQWACSVDVGAESYSESYDQTALRSLAEPNVYSPCPDAVDFYYESDYVYSYRGLFKFKNPALAETIYVEESRIPPPAGAAISDLSVYLIDSTAIREADQYAYQLGNEIPGNYESFILHGRLYLFDGATIRYVTTAAGIVQRVDYNSKALGLQLLASAPTAAFFYSPFDKSLWTFDGGETLAKFSRLAPDSDIYAAGYSVRENALAVYDRATYLETAGSVWFLRDGVMNRIPLALTGAESFADTEVGTWILSQGVAAKRLTYYAETGSTILPLRFDSLYCGYSPRLRQIVDRYAIRLLSPETEVVQGEGEDPDTTRYVPATVNIVYRHFSEEKHGEETASIEVGVEGHPYDDQGYAFIEFSPAQKACVAASLSLSCEEKIIVSDITVLTDKAGSTTIRNRG